MPILYCTLNREEVLHSTSLILSAEGFQHLFDQRSKSSRHRLEILIFASSSCLNILALLHFQMFNQMQVKTVLLTREFQTLQASGVQRLRWPCLHARRMDPQACSAFSKLCTLLAGGEFHGRSRRPPSIIYPVSSLCFPSNADQGLRMLKPAVRTVEAASEPSGYGSPKQAEAAAAGSSPGYVAVENPLQPTQNLHKTP
jgi:hypothetical protein